MRTAKAREDNAANYLRNSSTDSEIPEAIASPADFRLATNTCEPGCKNGAHDGARATSANGIQNEQDPTLAEFIEKRFIPEYVLAKRRAGRAHFYSTLKHVLTPEAVEKAFGVVNIKRRSHLRALPGWPYLDTVRLSDLHSDHVHNLISSALQHGYSTQTATHIRNLIGQVYSHACKLMPLGRVNPASMVKPPSISHRATRTLDLDELQLVLGNMRFPEREISVLSLLTDMTVSEICGLQWKCINLSSTRRYVEGAWLPPRTILIAKQSYRGELQDVRGVRRRHLRLSGVLVSVLQSVQARTGPAQNDAFLFSSRNATPVNQDNLANRRLKVIGKRIRMPWISWNVFHRTNLCLTSRYEAIIHDQVKKWLPWEISDQH